MGTRIRRKRKCWRRKEGGTRRRQRGHDEENVNI